MLLVGLSTDSTTEEHEVDSRHASPYTTVRRTSYNEGATRKAHSKLALVNDHHMRGKKKLRWPTPDEGNQPQQFRT